jgi:hypothetical protein
MRYFKIIFLSAAILLLSCAKESTHKPGYGWLRVTVIFNGIPSTSTTVFLANSLDDLNNQIYVTQATTNYRGIADFDELKAGTYVIGVTITVQNSYDRKKNKQITVQEGEVTSETLEAN